MRSDVFLIIAAPQAANPIADSLRRELDCEVMVVPHRRAGLAALRRAEFTLVLLEESLAGLDPEGADLLYLNAGAAPVLELNFSISSAPRVLRQVRAALARRAHDAAQARAAVTSSLQNDLNATLTGLLLESQLALREASPGQTPKLRHIVELAGDLRNRLRA